MASAIPGETKPKQPFHKVLWKEWIKPVGSVLLIMIVVRSSVIDWNDVPSGSMLPTIQIGDRVVVNKLAYGAQVPLSGPYLDIPLTRIHLKNPLADLPMLRWGEGPKRGDIITFWSPGRTRSGELDGRRLIKRVVAIPGDTIAVKDGLVYLNDKAPAYRAVGELRIEHVVRENGDTLDRPVRDGLEQAEGTPEHPVQFWDDRKSLREMNPITLKADEYFCMGDDRDDSGDARIWAQEGIMLTRRQITGRAFGVAWSMDGWLPRMDRFFKKLK